MKTSSTPQKHPAPNVATAKFSEDVEGDCDMNRVYSNTLLLRRVGTMSHMRLPHIRTMGFWIGFCYGTVGLVGVALVRLVFPVLTIVAELLLLPSRLIAGLLTSESSPAVVMVFLLYLITGIAYGLCGASVQKWLMRPRVVRAHTSL